MVSLGRPPAPGTYVAKPMGQELHRMTMLAWHARRDGISIADVPPISRDLERYDLEAQVDYTVAIHEPK